MLTTDPIYFKPLLPVITIKNTANNTTLYTYNSFTDSGTTDKVLYCSVRLSQNTFGEFVIQFEDQNKSLASTVTVGSRVQIDCGKQSSSLTRLISGLVRKKGYTRGADAKVLYTISGTSTGIRLNERITYAVSEAARLANGQIDFTDVSRKAKTLLASGLSLLTADGILSIANLAANSDVETFIPNTNIQYGELQDLVNYYEDQSGGEVVIDTTDLVHFRYEIKNNLFGRGFTIKNNNDNKANDDADDTMYLVGKNWTYEDDFYKSSSYANRFYALLSGETPPSNPSEIGGYNASGPFYYDTGSNCVAIKFRPSHSHYYANDFFVGISEVCGTSAVGLIPYQTNFLLVADGGTGTPNNKTSIIAIAYVAENVSQSTSTVEPPKVAVGSHFFNASTGATTASQEINLDTTLDYWFIMTPSNTQTTVGASDGKNTLWWYNTSKTVSNGVALAPQATLSRNGPYPNSGTGWTVSSNANPPLFAMPRIRSHSFSMYDPKAMQAVSNGLTGGLATDTLLTDAPHQVTTFDSMYRFMQQQVYNFAKPRTVYNFPTVTAPNIPPFPGDPIVINDVILGLSATGNQVAIGTCGDMTYQWGNQGGGSYEAPTRLSINAIAVHPRYR
jgi:hypothetical protein